MDFVARICGLHGIQKLRDRGLGGWEGVFLRKLEWRASIPTYVLSEYRRGGVIGQIGVGQNENKIRRQRDRGPCFLGKTGSQNPHAV